MPTKCCWVIHGSLTSERKASTSPSAFINHSTRPCCSIERSSAKLLVFTMSCTSKFERSTGSDVGSTRRRGNHMHDHSRFQCDINDVTGVSLSLSLSLSQKSLTHNIGSASALPIILLFLCTLGSTRGPLIAFEVSERVMEQTSGSKREKRTDDAAFDGESCGGCRLAISLIKGCS